MKITDNYEIIKESDDKLILLIVGSRDFNTYQIVEAVCNRLTKQFDKENIEIVSGGARGADYLGKQYAINYGIKYTEFPAEWDKYGKSAGYKRNRQMHEYIANKSTNRVCVAFWDGESKGTAHNFGLCKQFKHSLVLWNSKNKTIEKID